MAKKKIVVMCLVTCLFAVAESDKNHAEVSEGGLAASYGVIARDTTASKPLRASYVQTHIATDVSCATADVHQAALVNRSVTSVIDSDEQHGDTALSKHDPIELSEHVEQKNILQAEERKVNFENDLHDLQDLLNVQDNEKKHVESVNDINITIKAATEYDCPRRETITVKVKNNHWTIVFKNIPEDLLFEYLPVHALLPQSISRNRLEKYMNQVYSCMAKVMIYIRGKILAKYAKCTVTINDNVHPEKEHFPCTEIIYEVVDLAEKKEVDIQLSTPGLLNSEVTISKI